MMGLLTNSVFYFIPFSHYFFGSCDGSLQTRKVSVNVFERFDNSEFGTESIEFLMSNGPHQIQSANLQVTTRLKGVRYLMSEWFCVCLVATVCVVTTFVTSCVLALLLVIRCKGYLLFL